MPFPRNYLNFFQQCVVERIQKLFWIVLLLFSYGHSYAMGEGQPIHFSGDKQVWDRKANRVELFGHAAVSQVGETLTADYILLDLNSRTLDAKGNCGYLASDSLIWGAEMHFNLDTRTGTVVRGRVSNEAFTLRGEVIKKLGEGRFQTQNGEYSTCRDCAATWSILAENVDMEIEGYAYLSGVTPRVKNAPVFWVPYLIVPMKTHRQSGIIFHPYELGGNNGATFVIPYFWAINRSADMTIGVGQYTKRGTRLEWEGQYVYSNIDRAKANFYHLTDRTFGDGQNRWAFDVTQSHQLPWGLLEQVRFTEVSDNLYPYTFPNDLPRAGGEAFLASNLTISRPAADITAYFSLRRYRNLLNATPGDTNAQMTQYDPTTVQVYPAIGVAANDRSLFGTPLVGGISAGIMNFTRTFGTFDYDYGNLGITPGSVIPAGATPTLGIDPIRKATRVAITPSVYTSFRPFDTLLLVPSLQYRQYFYNFAGAAPSLGRSFLLFQTDLSTQLEKIYEYPDDKLMPRMKHLIRPILTYSYIPFIQEDNSHPFVAQIKNAQRRGIFGYNFDSNDIVPYGYTPTNANYFLPLGNSLSYGFTTQFIRRKGDVDLEMPSYQNVIEFSAGQGINFQEIGNPVDPSLPHIFTRFFSGLTFNFDHFTSQSTYSYNPDIFPVIYRHQLSTSATFIIERAIHDKILTYDRSFTLTYSYVPITSTSNIQGSMSFSLNDYLMPTGSVSYVLPQNLPTATVQSQLLGASTGLLIQSPSHCWKFTLGLNYAPATSVTYTIDFALNLTGSGYGGVADVANQVQSQIGNN